MMAGVSLFFTVGVAIALFATRVAVSASVAKATSGAMPINARLFGFSSYQGPVVNLTFDDEAVLRVVSVLRPGTLRYPGGTANSWNITNGRWVNGVQSIYAARTAALPEGTFGPVSYMHGVGGRVPQAPIWNLNLVTMPDPPSQLDELHSMGVPVEYVELGNEKADSDLASYLATCLPVTQRARQVFPGARVSIIGCWGKEWTTCAPQLKAARFPRSHPGLSLFDAVSIHSYEPDMSTVNKASTDMLRRSATLASVHPTLATMAARVADDIGPDVAIWLDEFNWGGSWSGATTWPAETRGSLRGLHWAAHVLSAISITANGRTNERAGFESLDYYSLLYQRSSPWSYWASIARVPDEAGRPHDVEFDGVAQIVAHVNHVVFGRGYTAMEALLNVSVETVPASTHMPPGPCVVAAKFTTVAAVDASGGDAVDATRTQSAQRSGTATVVALNVCPTAVNVTWPSELGRAGVGGVTSTVYGAHDVGGWVLGDDIQSLLSPPWHDGPITSVTSTSSTLPGALSNLTLTIIDVQLL